MRLRIQALPPDPEVHALQGLPRPTACKTSDLNPLRSPGGGAQAARKGRPAGSPLFEAHMVRQHIVLFVHQTVGKGQQPLQAVSRRSWRFECALCVSSDFRRQALTRKFVEGSRVQSRHLPPEERLNRVQIAADPRPHLFIRVAAGGQWEGEQYDDDASAHLKLRTSASTALLNSDRRADLTLEGPSCLAKKSVARRLLGVRDRRRRAPILEQERLEFGNFTKVTLEVVDVAPSVRRRHRSCSDLVSDGLRAKEARFATCNGDTQLAERIREPRSGVRHVRLHLARYFAERRRVVSGLQHPYCDVW